MKTLISLIVSLVMLTACASGVTPAKPAALIDLDVPVGSVVTGNGAHAYGTLAEYGSVEWTLAPLYTRNIMLRETALRRVKAGRITKAIASTIHSQLQAAHERIGEARIFEARPDVFKARVDQAQDLQDKAEQLLSEESK